MPDARQAAQGRFGDTGREALVRLRIGARKAGEASGAPGRRLSAGDTCSGAPNHSRSTASCVSIGVAARAFLLAEDTDCLSVEHARVRVWFAGHRVQAGVEAAFLLIVMDEGAHSSPQREVTQGARVEFGSHEAA